MKYFFPICILLCTSLSAQQPEYDRAWTFYTTGQYEEALTAIQQCIALDTTNYRYVFLKGKTLENLYRYADAITAQQAALRLNPGSLEARAALAALYLLSGQPAVSADYYGQLVDAEPQVIRWKMNWATALQAAGKPKEALEQLKMVEQNDTTNWLVYKNMGDCYFRIDSLIPTYNNYYKALTLYPHNKNLWGTLTRLLVTNGQEEGAIEVGNEAIAIDSTNVEAWKYLGIAWYKQGDSRQTYRALVKALALGDSSYTTISHYGVINYHIALNRNNSLYFLDAEKYLEKAHKMDPNDFGVMNYLADTYGYTGKAQKGLDIIDEIDKLVASFDTIGMKANIRRGHLYRRLNRNIEAANIFITATKNFPKDTRNYYEAGISYDRAQNKKLAIDWYIRYLEKIDPAWATKKWTEQELKDYEFVSTSINRIRQLREDLFFEEGEKSPK